MLLKDKVAIVTGGGRGIGRAVVLAFAREGARTVVAARTEVEVVKVAAEARKMGSEAMASITDVSNAESVRQMVRLAMDYYGRVDILVNNAGFIHPVKRVWEATPEEWMKNISINLGGVYLCTREVLPRMINQGSGRIINVSSGAGVEDSVIPTWSAYSAAKAAVVQFTRVVAEEVAEYGVAVNAVRPGLVNTSMQDELFDMGGDVFPHLEKFRERKEAGNMLMPEVPARLVLWLASHHADGITGQFASVHDRELQERIKKDLDGD